MLLRRVDVELEKNNMSDYEEELLEQRAEEWDDSVDDAQEM